MSQVLVINSGSSSLKYQVVAPASGVVEVGGAVERIGSGVVTDHRAALERMQADLARHGIGADDLAAVGHRVVHGGPQLVGPAVVDDDVLAEIETAARLAPLHNPPALAGIRSAADAFPGVAQVAVFDTGFFADLPAAAATYAIDADLAAREGVRRYGAHGISHQYVAGATADFLGRPLSDLSLIVLHLGNGASASAIRGGRPVDVSMGMTPLEGLVMGTRGGDLDPGVLIHLQRHAGLDLDEVEDLLHHRSGLLGLGAPTDFRDLERALGDGDSAARLAYDVYCHRLRRYVGGYLAVLGGADAVVFTAGVGEHNPRLRYDVLGGLASLGIRIDPLRNQRQASGPTRIAAGGSAVDVLVVPTNEELAIARQVVSLLG